MMPFETNLRVDNFDNLKSRHISLISIGKYVNIQEVREIRSFIN